MTISLKQIKDIIKKCRNLFRADNSTPLVKVVDEDLEAQILTPSQDLKAHFPDERPLADAYPDITARPTPDAARTYNPDSGNGHDIVADVDIDLTRDDRLEAYANSMIIPPETLEKWISAGILYPDEVRAAERLLKLIRQKVRRDNRLRGT